MKNSFAILAVALSALSAGAAVQAAESPFAAPELSRAQVKAELAAARAAGTIQDGDQTYIAPSVSTRSRADVRAELAVAVAAGTIQRGDQTYVPPSFSTQSRAAVTADLAAWREAGLANEWRGNATPDIYSTAYRAKLAAYEHALASQQASRS